MRLYISLRAIQIYADVNPRHVIVVTASFVHTQTGNALSILGYCIFIPCVCAAGQSRSPVALSCPRPFLRPPLPLPENAPPPGEISACRCLYLFLLSSSAISVVDVTLIPTLQREKDCFCRSTSVIPGYKYCM